MRTLFFLLLLTGAAFAQESTKQLQAIPALVQQRNGAMDGLAMCVGESDALKKENEALKAEIEKLKKKDDQPK